MYLSKTDKFLISLSKNQVFYTSLRYRDDKRRRSLHKLKKLGYFEQISRFGFKRTDKIIENENKS